MNEAQERRMTAHAVDRAKKEAANLRFVGAALAVAATGRRALFGGYYRVPAGDFERLVDAARATGFKVQR